MEIERLSLRPVLGRFADGGLFRAVIGNVVRLAAVVVFLGGLLAWFGAWRMIGNARFFAGVGLVVFQLAALLALVAVAHLVFVRGTDITRLPESGFPLAPIFATLVRLEGEIAIVFLGILSLPVALLVWFGGGYMAAWIPFLPGGGGFVAGLGAFVICWVTGFVALIVTYFLAELITVLFAMASDMRRTRAALEPTSHGTAA
jgi:hypothetical protein